MLLLTESLDCVVADAVSPPERPDTPPQMTLMNNKSKRSLDFTVSSDSVETVVKESLVCNNNSVTNGPCQLDNSFIVPLEESFTESKEVKSVKRNLCFLDSSSEESKFDH